MERLHQQAIDAALADLDGWICINDHHLVKRYAFPDFVTAQAFVNKVGDAAEAQDHHPEITFGWGHAQIEVYTHSAGGITAKDFQLAAASDSAYASSSSAGSHGSGCGS